MCCLKFISKLLVGFSGAMLLLAILLQGATNQEFLDRDKNGTTGGPQKTIARKPLVFMWLRAIVHWMRREGDSLTADLLPGFLSV